MRASIKQIVLSFVKFFCTLYYPVALLVNKTRKNDRINILSYHSVHANYSVDYEWSIPLSLFALHMAYLEKNHCPVLTMDETIACLRGEMVPPKNAVCITFDDGYKNNYTLAYPVLIGHGFVATFYVVTAFLDKPIHFPFDDWNQKDVASVGGDVDQNLPLKWEGILCMTAKGMVFGSHSHTHCRLSTADEATIQREIEESTRVLSERLPQISNTFVCPYGAVRRSSGIIREHLEKRKYAAAFMGRFGSAKAGSDLFDLPRITIYGKDSLFIFKQKLTGAYDWVGYVYSFWRYLLFTLTHRNIGNKPF